MKDRGRGCSAAVTYNGPLRPAPCGIAALVTSRPAQEGAVQGRVGWWAQRRDKVVSARRCAHGCAAV